MEDEKNGVAPYRPYILFCVVPGGRLAGLQRKYLFYSK